MKPFDYDAELSRYHQRLLAAIEVGPDDDVLDIGCGTGLTTRDAARRAASATGVDLNPESLATARLLSSQDNLYFEHADAQVHPFPAEHFSLGISRFGTMFFSDPQAAFTNIGRALRPGARLVQLVWQERRLQGWDAAIRDAIGDLSLGGSAFSLADPSTASALLTAAGFVGIQHTEVREPVYYGDDAEAAYDAVRNFWMPAEVDAPDEAFERLRANIAACRREDGIWFDSRAWIITAHRP